MHNLRLYHKLLAQICQWFPGERITRKRNLALMMVGLYQGASIHLSHIARELPIAGKDPSLVNRLRRFLNNPRITVRKLYRPVALQVLSAFVGRRIRLVIDCTKIGFRYRLMTVSLAYRKRTIPLVWRVHSGSRGHTTAQQQIELLNYVRTLLPVRSQVWVLGDAGFQSVLLLRWLSRQHEKQPWFRSARKWHAGVEGRISVLKRCYDLDRCLNHGIAGFQRWVGWGVIAHNLKKIGATVAARSG